MSDPTANQSPIFDVELLLSYLDGDREIAADMIEGLIADMPLRVQGIRDALASADLAALRREVHTIKGLAAGGGAVPLSELAHRIETACREGSLEVATRQVPELERQIDDVVAAWRGFSVEGPV